MNIFVLTLYKDICRRKLLKESFPIFYDHFNFFYGFTKIDHSSMFFFNKSDMTNAEILCALGHIEILNKVVASDCKSALILEDDIIGSDDLIQKIFDTYNTLPLGSVLIAGGHEGVKAFENLYGFQYSSCVFKIPRTYYRYLSRACCYVVTKEIASEIINLQKRRLVVADQWDVLLNNVDNVYYSSILKHPISLEDSNIEMERKNKRAGGMVYSVFREGVVKSFYYYLRKKITKAMALVNGYEKVIKNKHD